MPPYIAFELSDPSTEALKERLVPISFSNLMEDRAPPPKASRRVVPGQVGMVTTKERADRSRVEARRQRIAKQQPVKSMAAGSALNFGLGNMGGPGKIVNRLRTGSDLYNDLLEFNPISVDEFEQRWSKRHAIVRMAHVQLSAELQDRQYVLVGGTDEAREFHESWIEKILPGLLDHVVSATWYGWMPFAIEWAEAAGDRWVPSRVLDLDPFWAQPFVDASGDVVSIEQAGVRYGPEQILHMVWMGEGQNPFGDGQAIVANPWWKALCLLMLWKMGYYEAAVHSPKLGWAKNIKYTIDGEEVDLSEILADAIGALSGGDSAGLPLEYDEQGNPIAKVDLLTGPDRADTFIKAIDKVIDVLYTAALVVPGAGLTANSQSYGSSRTSEKREISVLELVGSIVVRAVNRRNGVLENAHRINGLAGACPRLEARPQKREQMELLKELVKPSLAQVVPETDEKGRRTGNAYRVQDLIPFEAVFKLMDIPTRSARSVARDLPDEPAPGVGGRPPDPYGDRADDRGSGLER